MPDTARIAEKLWKVLVDPPPLEAQEPLPARVLGVLALVGGALGLVSVVLPHPEGSEDAALIAIAVVALVTGAALLSAGRRIPTWLNHAAVAGAGLLICSAVYFSGLVAVYASMLFWVALFSAFFFSRRAALLHLAWLLACYAVVLSLVHDPAGYSPLTRWLLLAIALSVTSTLTSWLVARRKAAEQRSDHFFELSGDMLCTASVDGYFIEVNPAWTATLGYSAEELRSRPFADFVHPDDRERAEAETARTFEGSEVVAFENRYRAKDGSWRWLLWSSRLSRDQGVIYARATDVTERKRLEAEREELVRELDSQARTDALTGLPNRRWLGDELDRELSRADRMGHDLRVALIDLDHFKRYNDEHGHQAGDELLREAAERWRSTLRVSDFLARYGGEEFIVLLPDCGPTAALTTIERVRAATPARQTCSAGIATWDRLESARDLVARADTALYAAKAAGRDQVSTAEPTLSHPSA